MLENPTPAAAAPPPDSSTVKRYAPPNQRNRSLNRRKSGDRFDRGNSVYPNDGEKNQQQAHGNPRNNSIPVTDHGDAGSSSTLNDNYRHILIPLEGCSRSDASQLLNDRWEATVHNYNDASIDLSERPVMYSGSSASAWGPYKLPHQVMSPANSVGAPSPQVDFLSELRRAMHKAKASYEN